MPPCRSSNELTATQHLDGAAAHLAFGDGLRNAAVADPTVVGWAITALFYCAVHAVRAYLVAAKGVRVVAHEDLRSLTDQFPELQTTATPYRTLKEQSESARYYLNQNWGRPEDRDHGGTSVRTANDGSGFALSVPHPYGWRARLLPVVLALRARVSNGRLVLDEPVDLPEGTEVDLVPADEGDDLDADERARLHAALARAADQLARGEGVAASDALERLRARADR